MRRQRLMWSAAGVALIGFGAIRLLIDVPVSSLFLLAGWLIAAVVVHDLILAPLVVGVGVLVARVPSRARRSVQGALVAGALIASVAVPLVLRRGTQPAVKALLRRDYLGGLLVLLGIVVAVAVVAYLVRVFRDRLTASAPPEG